MSHSTPPLSKTNSKHRKILLNKVAYDSRWIGDHGIGRFAKEVANRLSFDSYYTEGKNPAGFFSAIKLGLWARHKKAGAIYSPSYIPPLLSAVPFSFTIHDLNHIDIDHNSSLLKRAYYRFIILPAIKRAHKVLTVSEFSKQRIINWSGCPAEKIIVVGNGVSTAFNVHVTPFNPGYVYIFCCSNRKGHKNEERLLHAYKLSKLDHSTKLIFTGSPDKKTLLLIKKLDLDNSVVFSGRASEEELASLYKGAVATVFPSLYEGFGLPLIESMACGTPVIASNTTSLPEVGGDAGFYVDPMCTDSISSGLLHIVNNENIQIEMREKGLARAKDFTWDKTASLVLDALVDMPTKCNTLKKD